MNLKEQLQNELLKNRPNLSVNSLKTYISTLANLPQKVDKDINMEDVNVEWFHKNISNITKYLLDIENTKRKSVSCAVFILTNNEIIQAGMLTDIKDVNELYKTQTKSITQNANWIEWSDVIILYDNYEQKADAIFKKKIINPDDFNFLNEFMLFSCFVLFEPRRNLDYALMKIHNFDKDVDNYITPKEVCYNVYKTSKIYGQQKFPVGVSMAVLIKKWSKINPYDNLLVSSTLKPMVSSQITKMLNKIFGKNISCDILRHSYISSIYKNIPQLTKMNSTANRMGHSVATAMEYIKR